MVGAEPRKIMENYKLSLTLRNRTRSNCRHCDSTLQQKQNETWSVKIKILYSTGVSQEKKMSSFLQGYLYNSLDWKSNYCWKCVIFLPPGSSCTRGLCDIGNPMGPDAWKRQRKRKDVRKREHAITLESFQKIQKWLEWKKGRESRERKVGCILAEDYVHAVKTLGRERS